MGVAAAERSRATGEALRHWSASAGGDCATVGWGLVRRGAGHRLRVAGWVGSPGGGRDGGRFFGVILCRAEADICHNAPLSGRTGSLFVATGRGRLHRRAPRTLDWRPPKSVARHPNGSGSSWRFLVRGRSVVLEAPRMAIRESKRMTDPGVGLYGWATHGLGRPAALCRTRRPALGPSFEWVRAARTVHAGARPIVLRDTSAPRLPGLRAAHKRMETAGTVWVLMFGVGGADVAGGDERQGGVLQPAQVRADDLGELRKLRQVLVHALHDELPSRAVASLWVGALRVEDVPPTTRWHAITKVPSPNQCTNELGLDQVILSWTHLEIFRPLLPGTLLQKCFQNQCTNAMGMDQVI